jgi:hypothetical protein
MKLSKSQIDQLFNFTRQHYVEWYDLQSELVDHLANAIETEWEQNPKLTFDEVLNNEFRKFGVFGFMDVVEEKQKGLSKKYSRLIWSYYKEFFRLPKVILTIAIVFGLHIIIDVFKNPFVLQTIAAVSLMVSFVFVFKKRFYLKQKAQETGKKWLFEEIMINRVSLLLFLLPSMVLNFFNTFKDRIVGAEWSLIFGEIAFVLVGLLIFIQLIIIPKKVSEELTKTYPEYSLQKV